MKAICPCGKVLDFGMGWTARNGEELFFCEECDRFLVGPSLYDKPRAYTGREPEKLSYVSAKDENRIREDQALMKDLEQLYPNIFTSKW
jgi:hypothetical protein